MRPDRGANPQTIAQIWRYPVKSMHGEKLDCAELTTGGMLGDRRYAFESSGAPPGMLRLTGAERRQWLRYRARTAADGTVWVDTPGGAYAADSPDLLATLPSPNRLTLIESQKPQTDCRPLALISLATIQALGEELGSALDPRRFRANLYLGLSAPFAEDALVGQTVQIGTMARLRILERDPRCRFVTLDPETTEPLPELMRLLDRAHQGRAGVYAAIERPGVVELGDRLILQ